MRARLFFSRVAALMIAALAWSAAASAQADMAEVQVQMAEARRHFDALEYEQVIPPLDRVIAILTARRTDETRKTLADAYEMRARSRYGTGDQNGAREDFIALLRADPGHTLSGQISPRVVTMFEDAQKATITSVKLTIVPPTADVTLDGVPVRGNSTVSVLVGEHTVAAKQLGYRTGTATFTATSGTPSEATLELARSSAVLSVVTSPADVDVLVDGLPRGKTVVGPPAASFAPRAQSAGIPMSSLSAILVASDLTSGSHRIEFRRPCFVPAERRVEVTQLQDIVLDPVKLDPATGTIVAQSSQPGAMVFIDGQDRGPAPFTAELCEGEHLVELRSQYGRYSRRVDARPGQRVEVSGALRPSFAIVSTTPQTGSATDIRTIIERTFEPVKSVSLFAPPADRLDQTLRSSQLPQDWLAFDANRKPLTTSADITTPMRRDLSSRIARAFDAQGVASVSTPTPGNRSRVVLSLLGAGSADPDVIEINLDRPDSIADAIAQIDRPIAFSRPTIGVTAIDVADVNGAVVVAVAAGGAGAQAGIQPGDLIVKAGDAAVTNTNALLGALSTKKANDPIALELKDKAGAAKRAEPKVQMTPRLISVLDQSMLANRMLVDLRTQLMSPANATEESIIRLNMAAALVRLQAWNDARTELQKVKLGDGAGVGNGTVQYLLGLCADGLGDRAGAETALRAAAASASWVTEDGPPVKEVAEAKLAEISKRPIR